MSAYWRLKQRCSFHPTVGDHWPEIRDLPPISAGSKNKAQQDFADRADEKGCHSAVVNTLCILNV